MTYSSLSLEQDISIPAAQPWTLAAVK